jgi:hypothetical protein
MHLLRHLKLGGSGWRNLLIAAAICSLTFSLATRFSIPTDSQAHTAKSVERRSVEPKRQHLDRDAAGWAAPIIAFENIEPADTEVSLASTEPIFPTHIFSSSLYNRPPPSSEFLR